MRFKHRQLIRPLLKKGCGSICLIALFLVVADPKASAHQQSQTTASEIQRLMVLLQKGEINKASQLAETIIENPRTNFDSLLQIGQLLGNYRMFSEARTAFRRALQENPASFAAAFNLGLVDLQEGELLQARKYLARSVQLNPASFQADLVLGVLLIRLRDRPYAINYLRRASQLEPKNAEVLRLLAAQYEAAGSNTTAINLLTRAIEVGGPNPGTCILEVEAYNHADQYSKALKTARDCAQQLPRSARLQFLLGSELQRLGQFDQSTQSFESALAVDARFPEAEIALAELYSRQARYGNAIQLLRKAQAIRPNDPEIPFQLAQNYEKLGDSVLAKQTVVGAIEEGLEDPRYHLLLSDIYFEEGHNTESQKEKQIFMRMEKLSARPETDGGSSHH